MSDSRKRIKSEQQLAEDFQWLATTQQGRRIRAWLFGYCQVFQEINETDPIALGMQIGENNLAKRIARYMSLDPEVFASAMRENNEAIKQNVGNDEYQDLMKEYLAPPPPIGARVQ